MDIGPSAAGEIMRLFSDYAEKGQIAVVHATMRFKLSSLPFWWDAKICLAGVGPFTCNRG